MDILPNAQFADPSQFAIAWDALFEVLLWSIIAAFFVERVLSVLFEYPDFIRLDAKVSKMNGSRIKPLVALVLSIPIALGFKFDVLAILAGWSTTSYLGCIFSGFLIAGGSKASIKLFHDVWGVKSNAFKRFEQTGSLNSSNKPPTVEQVMNLGYQNTQDKKSDRPSPAELINIGAMDGSKDETKVTSIDELLQM